MNRYVFTALPTGKLPTNDPRREQCEAGGCDQLATIVWTFEDHWTIENGLGSSAYRLCPTHAGEWAGEAAEPDSEQYPNAE